MKFSNSEGSALELTIVDYQLPNTTDEEYDANWLRVRISATLVERSWSTIEPCLLTWEVERLAQWFEKIDSGQPVELECTFLEPVLSFRLIEDKAGQKVIRVYFELEGRPSWASSPSAGQEDLWIDFPIQEVNLDNVAKSLYTQLQHYPKRAIQAR